MTDEPEPFTPRLLDEGPSEFHHRVVPPDTNREVWVPNLEPETLVLGSRQHEAVANRSTLDDLGVALTTRRSGGGAVLVSPTDVTWFDVILHVSDPLWTIDVAESFMFLSRAIDRTLKQMNGNALQHLEIYSGPLQRTDWSDLVCFAGLGPGELHTAGSKLVGMSQRRTRTTARIQVAVVQSWRPERLLSLLDLNPSERDAAAVALRNVAFGVPHDPKRLVGAVIDELNRADV